MRLFTAIPLPKLAKDRVSEITRGRLPIPYINTTNLHISLNFFGELSDAEVEKVKAIFLETTQGLPTFHVEFVAIVQFHQQLHITVKPSKQLSQLQSKLEKAFKAHGFTFQERNYYPHVKLGNMHLDNIMHRERKIENFPNSELTDLNFNADKITLYESKLLLHHPKHTSILEVSLK